MTYITSKIKEKFNDFINEGKNDLKKIKSPKDLTKQIPNLFTISRLLLVPFIITNVLSGNFIAAGLFSIGASVTDLIDGKVARALDATSSFGAKLDAIVDKIFITSITLPLAITNPYLIIPVLLDMMIASINGYAHIHGIKTKTNIFGKVKTAFLDTLICSLFFKEFKVINNISKVLYLSTIALQLKTAKVYYKDYIATGINEEESNEFEKQISNDQDDEKTKVKELKRSKNIELENLMKLKNDIENFKNIDEEVIGKDKVKIKKSDY